MPLQRYFFFFFLIILSNMPVLYREHRTSWARTSSPSASGNVINCPRSFSSVWMSFSSLYPILHQSQSTSVGVTRGVRKSSCLVDTGKKGGFRVLCGQRVTWGELLCTTARGITGSPMCRNWVLLVPALKGYKCKWKRLWKLLGELKSNFTRAQTLMHTWCLSTVVKQLFCIFHT